MHLGTTGSTRSDAIRVAIFTDSDFEKINGVTTTLKAVLRHAGKRAEPRVYTAAHVGIDTPAYYSARSFGLGLPWYREMRIYWPRWQRFARELRRQNVQVLHTTTPGPVGLAARWLAARLRLPLVGSYHTELGDYVGRLSGSAVLGRVSERYVQWYYEPCAPLLVPSMATRTLLLSRGYRADRLRVWGRGVDVGQFSPQRASPARRRQWGAHERCPVILYAGRLSREKDLAIIGGVRRQLIRRGLAHRLIFAGDGPMRHELQEICPDAVFLGSLVHDDVATVMASADIFLFPSATDTLGNVVLEAQAAGLPVIVSDRGGPHQHMIPNETGVVCPAGDADGFSNALVRLLMQPERRAEMGRRARTYAESRGWPEALVPLVEAWAEARVSPAGSEGGVPRPAQPAALAGELNR